jgi:pimeloyl-ACP methyl ester carboxylesterase
MIVGHSWGAMLALAYAASYPNEVRGIVLVGCGTFDQASRDKMNETINKRLDDESRRLLADLSGKYPDWGDRIKAKYDLIGRVHDFDVDQPPIEARDIEPFDIKAHNETWNDMLRLQGNGTYPQAFDVIRVPVLMLHGCYDPHPGRMIYESLKPHIRQLQYVELDRCGHEPWRERHARGLFFRIMIDWMTKCFQA